MLKKNFEGTFQEITIYQFLTFKLQIHPINNKGQKVNLD